MPWKPATFTIGLLATLTLASPASAGDNGVISPGGVVSAYWSAATSWELGAGVDVSYMYYRGSFFRGDLGRGGYLQVQGIFGRDLERDSRTRFVLGGQLAKYTVLGGMLGGVYETGNSKVPESFGVEAAPYFSLGIMSVWATLTVPISDLFVPSHPRGVQFGAHLAGKLPITVHGSSVYNDVTLASGRPLRASDGRVLVAAVQRARAEATPLGAELSPHDRETLAAMWMRDATMEHASIAAFARLSLELMALGAPLELVDGAHRAAREEVAHARACFGMASAYGGVPLEPGALPVSARRIDLLSLAIETYVDGCIGEGAAAAAARLGARRARVREPRTVLRKIARDEAAHARLAWEIVAFCVVRDERVLPALLRLAQSTTTSAPPSETLAAHGFVSDDERRALTQATAKRARATLRRLACSSSSTAGTRSRRSARTMSLTS